MWLDAQPTTLNARDPRFIRKAVAQVDRGFVGMLGDLGSRRVCDAMHPAVKCREDCSGPRRCINGARASRCSSDCFCRSTAYVDYTHEESNERHMGADKGDWRELLHVCETPNLVQDLQRTFESHVTVLSSLGWRLCDQSQRWLTSCRFAILGLAGHRARSTV